MESENWRRFFKYMYYFIYFDALMIGWDIFQTLKIYITGRQAVWSLSSKVQQSSLMSSICHHSFRIIYCIQYSTVDQPLQSTRVQRKITFCFFTKRTYLSDTTLFMLFSPISKGNNIRSNTTIKNMILMKLTVLHRIMFHCFW